MAKKFIHVNRQILASNRKNNKDEPALTMKTYKSNDKCFEIDILGQDGSLVAKVIHSEKPLSCGARAYIEVFGKTKIYKKRTKDA